MKQSVAACWVASKSVGATPLDSIPFSLDALLVASIKEPLPKVGIGDMHRDMIVKVNVYSIGMILQDANYVLCLVR